MSEIIYLEDAAVMLLRGKGVAAAVQHFPQSLNVEFEGKNYFAVPHGYDETVLLRNLGFEVQSPMGYGDFEWPGRFTPYEHQRATSDHLVCYEKSFVLNDLGTGKTASAIWSMMYLRRKNRIRAALIICPLTTMRDVWERELFNIDPGATVEVLYGSSAQRRAALTRGADYFIINHDGIKIIEDELNDLRAEIDLVVIDESTAYKTPRSDRTRALMRIARYNNRRVWAMTGTPMPALPTDIWTMARLICPQLVDESFTLFRDRTCDQITMHKWRPKRGAVQKVLDRLHPAVCYRKQDCLDLPSVQTITRNVPLTKRQAELIKTVTNEMVATIDGTKMTIANAGVLINKVRQILQGIIITNSDAGTGSIFGAPDRVATVLELVESSNSKTIVFAPYRLALDYLEGELKKHVGLVRIDGEVGERARSRLLRQFEEDDDTRVLLAHPRTTSHGLTLVQASTIVWYGPEFSAETYKQAVNRIDRPGQKHKMTIAHLVSHPVEREIYRITENRLNVQAQLLELVAQLTGETYG